MAHKLTRLGKFESLEAKKLMTADLGMDLEQPTPETHTLEVRTVAAVDRATIEESDSHRTIGKCRGCTSDITFSNDAVSNPASVDQVFANHETMHTNKTHPKQYIFSTGGDFDRSSVRPAETHGREAVAGHASKIHKLLVTDDFVFSNSHDK